MDNRVKQLTSVSLFVIATVSLSAMDLTKAYDMPDASKMIAKDLIDKATKYTMPKSCNLKDADAIARGNFMFNHLNGKKIKASSLPKGLAQFVEKKGKDGKSKKKPKQYGNCIACHDIEGSLAPGNIGPSLVGYKAMFIDSKARDAQFVYQ
ncbi:MAG: sulfur oxidation c-type cytochrome SoxX, partial [Candidatus Izimaplasma sp.]|nr:sulfur oxidation c-type cytochrome SoxX [Candidatus Izimaplasma bacterium]